MTSTFLGKRLWRQAAAAVVLLAAFGAGTAQADITGTVTTPLGGPVAGVTVEAVGPTGVAVAGVADNTDAFGAYVISTAKLAAAPGPYTLTTSTETCRKDEGGEAATTSSAPPPVADGAVVPLQLDVLLVCAALEPEGAAPTGHVWVDRGRFLGTPRSTFALDLLVPQEASAFVVTDAKGTVLGTGASRLGLRFRAPAKPFTGPLTLNWTEAGVPGGRPIGTLAVAKAVKPKPPRGAVDLGLVVDTSDVLGGSARASQRSAALSGLIDEAGGGDRIFATSFSSGATTIFPRSTVSGASSRARLKQLAGKQFVASGGTDYDAGFGSTFTALTDSPAKRSRPKAAVFIADSEHDDGEYNNTHLRFAFNGSARPWPVCVVQLGGGFSAQGTALLKRIARDTTGTYRRVSGVGGLANAVTRCDP